jgi:hypothetical protein
MEHLTYSDLTPGEQRVYLQAAQRLLELVAKGAPEGSRG